MNKSRITLQTHFFLVIANELKQAPERLKLVIKLYPIDLFVFFKYQYEIKN